MQQWLFINTEILADVQSWDEMNAGKGQKRFAAEKLLCFYPEIELFDAPG